MKVAVVRRDGDNDGFLDICSRARKVAKSVLVAPHRRSESFNECAEL
jgi:hypothetical protein